VKITNFKNLINTFDTSMAKWMYSHGKIYLRFSLAFIFIWFGALKPLGLSPAQGLVERTVYWFDPEIFIPILGWWEVSIGVCLLFKPVIRGAIFLLFLQVPGTFLPLILLPEICFTQVPFGLTLEGQYIIKNLILISAGIVIGGTVRKTD
jgi:uncharacterized membrane protein YkgB